MRVALIVVLLTLCRSFGRYEFFSPPLLKLSRISKTSNGPPTYDLEVASSDCTRESVAVTEVPLPSFEVMLKRPPEFRMRWDPPSASCGKYNAEPVNGRDKSATDVLVSSASPR